MLLWDNWPIFSICLLTETNLWLSNRWHRFLDRYYLRLIFVGTKIAICTYWNNFLYWEQKKEIVLDNEVYSCLVKQSNVWCKVLLQRQKPQISEGMPLVVWRRLEMHNQNRVPESIEKDYRKTSVTSRLSLLQSNGSVCEDRLRLRLIFR